MGIVVRAFTVLTLGDALRLRAAACLPARALVISFDDGYADNAEIALPILMRHGLRATFFVASGFLDGGRMFNDSVIECLRHAGGERIDLSEFGLGVRSLASARERREAIDALLPKFKYSGLGCARGSGCPARCPGGQPLRPDLMMRSDQVVELHRAGMEIGGHTVRHPILRLTTDAEADRNRRWPGAPAGTDRRAGRGLRLSQRQTGAGLRHEARRDGQAVGGRARPRPRARGR